jgi:hypothetical protein
MQPYKPLARFNWYVMLCCFLLFAGGGTLAGLGAIALSGSLALFVVSMLLCIGLYAAAACTLVTMDRCS